MKVGDSLPDVTVTLASGKTIPLAHLGKPLVLFFYPKAFSPVCAAEACHFRDLSKEFEAVGAAVYGVAPDSNADLDRFQSSHRLPFPSISDPDKALAKAFGAVGALGMLKRLTVVADSQGKVVAAISTMLNAHAHADQALAAVKGQRQ